MKIVNYKGIKNFEYDETKVNVFYGQNGIGKTTIKDVIAKSAIGEEIEENKNIDLLEEENYIDVSSFLGSKVLKFDEEYVGQYVYNKGSLKDSNKYEVLFSKELIDKTKAEAAEITKLLHSNYSLLDTLVNDFSNQIKMFNDYFDDRGPKTKLKNITKTEVDVDFDYLSLDFTRVTNDMHIWWRDGYQKHWNATNTNCIFCNQDINVSPIGEILRNKRSNNINHTTQTKFLTQTNILNDVLASRFDNTVEKLKTAVIESYSKDVTSSLVEVKDELLPFVQLNDRIISKRNRITRYIYSFEDLNLVDLEIKDYKDIVNESYCKIISEYNLNLIKIEKAKDDYENTLRETKETLSNMIKENELLFNEILDTFGLNYKIQIPANGLDINLEKLDYKFNLHGSNDVNKRDIINESSSILSFGEKNTLAFAFFLIECIHSLKIRNETDKLTIILDDPISSHDIFRKYSTVDLVNKHIVKNLEKDDFLFIFTHEFEFILPIRETIVKSIREVDSTSIKLNGLNFQSDRVEVFKLEGRHFTNSIIRMKKNINGDDANIISKIVMMRILREIDCLLYGIKMKNDNLFGFFSDIIHTNNSKSVLNQYDFDIFKTRYKLAISLDNNAENYKQYFNDVDFDNFIEIDKYYFMRPYIEFLLAKENLKLIDGSYKRYSKNEVVGFIDKNFSFLNSSVHQKMNEDEVSFNDVKEFEMFSSKMFDEFRACVNKWFPQCIFSLNAIHWAVSKIV